MPTVADLKTLRAAAATEAEKIISEAESANESKGRPLTPEEQTKFDGLRSQIEELTARIENSEYTAGLSVSSSGRRTSPSPIQNHDEQDPFRRTIPATAKRFQSMQHFSRLRFVKERGVQQDLAYRFGAWCVATMGNPSAMRFCEREGLELRVHQEKVNSQGGYLVPEELDSALIDLREQYGLFRQYARPVQMNTDKKSRVRITGGLTAYFVAEGGAITDSTMAWDRVTLNAKDLGAIALITNDLNEDAMVNIGDVIAGEIVRAFTNKEDDCGWNGDGTSTYGGIVGVRNAFLNLSATRANIAGVVVGAGNAWSELTLANFHSVIGKLPRYVSRGNVRWFVHNVFWADVMQRLTYAAGGVTATEMVNGVNMDMFLGFPVEKSTIFPAVEANDVVCAVLGDLALAADFGDRKQTAISLSEHATVGTVNCFAQNQIAVRGVERFDINVHDVGNASATAALRVPGPIVALITAAS